MKDCIGEYRQPPNHHLGNYCAYECKYTKECKEISESDTHAHPAYFGSELACHICNPVCHENHGMGKGFFCGHEECPMNPKRFTVVTKGRET